MKKIIILFSGIIISLLFCSTAFASDNFFVGTDTVDEVYEDLDIIYVNFLKSMAEQH